MQKRYRTSGLALRSKLDMTSCRRHYHTSSVFFLFFSRFSKLWDNIVPIGVVVQYRCLELRIAINGIEPVHHLSRCQVLSLSTPAPHRDGSSPPSTAHLPRDALGDRYYSLKLIPKDVEVSSTMIWFVEYHRSHLCQRW